MGDAKNIIVRPISARDANKIIKALHYSGKVVNNSQLHLGVFYEGRCGGAMQFGPSLDKRKIVGLVKGTLWNEFLELNRLAFADWLPRNGESRCIAYAMRFIKKNYPWVKWVISFADGTQCGDGTIYRASGFVLTQVKQNSSLYETPCGTPIARMTWDSATPEHRAVIAKQYGMMKFDASSFLAKTAKLNGIKSLTGYQLRYIYFLNKEARQRLTVPVLPFSKIDEMGAGMYKGIPKRVTKATSGDQPEGGGAIPTHALQNKRDKQAIGGEQCVTSIDSDAPGDQLGERGASPTVTLQNNNEDPNAENP